MRMLRPRLLLLVTSLAGLGLWVACGDDNNAAVVDAGVADTGVSVSLPDVSVPDVVTTPPSGPSRDAGIAVQLDAGSAYDGGFIPCFAGGILETEPNNSIAQANELPDGSIADKVISRVICGVTDNGSFDGGAINIDAGDHDFLTFTLGDASTDFYVRYDGNIAITIETDGSAPVDISQSGVTIPKAYGQPYYAHIHSKDGKTQTWKVILFEDQPGAH